MAVSLVPVRDGVVDSPGMEAGERPKGGVYCPRNRRASALYQCVDRHGEELRAAGAIHRAVEEHVLERYIGCGDLHRGFAQIRCKRCGRNYLLAFSCKTRFCPACHQKRMLLVVGHRLSSARQHEVLSPLPCRNFAGISPALLCSVRHLRPRAPPVSRFKTTT